MKDIDLLTEGVIEGVMPAIINIHVSYNDKLAEKMYVRESEWATR